MTCEQLVAYLSDYIDGILGDELAQVARHHLATCTNCRIMLDSTRKTILLYRERGQIVHIPDNRHHALFDRIAAAFAERDANRTD